MDEQNGLPELPKGWISTTLGNVVLSTRPKVMPNNFPNLQYVGLEHIEAHTTKLLGSVPATTMRSQAVHFFPKDVLYSRLRPYLNKVASLDFEGLSSSEFIVFPQNDSLLSEYLLYFLNQYAFVSFANGLNEGDRPRVDLSQIGVYPFPLPPLNEQARIVAKIEELFTKLDAGIDALRLIRKQIKRYRQAVLRDAVTGELTKAWREENRAELEPADALLKRILDERRTRWEQEQQKKFAESGKTPKNADWKKKYKEPAAPSTENLPELPISWTWATIQQFASFEPYSITDGPFGSNLKTSHYKDSGARVIRLKNIGDGIFVDAKAYISVEHFDFLKKHQIKDNDLVIATLGERLPFACIIPDFVGDAIVKADCVRFSPNKNLADVKYLNFALNAENTRERVTKGIHGVGRPRLNLSEVREIALSLPPLAEQQKIVEEVERLLSVADAIEQTVGQSLKQAMRLRQSILKRAFEGNLVPQDDADEPASILLERIKQEREEIDKSKKTKGKFTRKNQKENKQAKLF